MRKLFLAILTVILAASCGKAPLQRGNWDERVYKTLNEMILTYGSGGKAYDPAKKAYAVFDFDNTTIMNDVELSLMTYQFDNLRFSIDPEDMFGALTCMIPNLDTLLRYRGQRTFTAREIAEDIASDYKFLHERYISAGEKDLDGIRQTDEFKDFRAKMFALYAGISDTFDYGPACLWITSMFGGMTTGEITSLTKESYEYALSEDSMYQEVWESPQMGKAGKVTSYVTRGMTLTPEMRDLYKTLMANGIDVYICSASHELVVEAMACDGIADLGMTPDRVLGMRVLSTPEGFWKVEYDPEFIQPYHEGKVGAIREFIAPMYGGQDPVLVAGDSNGDYNMLTELPGLKVGLIINCMRGGKINDLMTVAVEDKSEGLKNRSSPLYVVQGRNAARKMFIPSWDSIPVVK